MEPTTATFFDLVRDQLPQVEARMRANAGVAHPSLSAAIEQLLTSGGKRIRPALVLLTCGMLGADSERSVTLAAAIEMLHTATLVHDDLIDQSTLRRGLPTLNAQWNAGATVLTGDYIFARAAALAAETESLPVMSSFARTLMTIVNGEINQLFDGRGHSSRQEYFDRIYAKTASLFELATGGSALLAQSSDARVRALQQFGYDVGVAFQIIDDVLDFVAEEDYLGKPVASDLRQGIVTLPVLLYLEEVGQMPPVLKSVIEGEPAESDEFDRLVADMRQSGSIEAALDEARAFAEQGIDRLDSMPACPERDGLRDLANYVVQRNL